MSGPANFCVLVPGKNYSRPVGLGDHDNKSGGKNLQTSSVPVNQADVGDTVGPGGLPCLDYGLRLKLEAYAESILRGVLSLLYVCEKGRAVRHGSYQQSTGYGKQSRPQINNNPSSQTHQVVTIRPDTGDPVFRYGSSTALPLPPG